MNAMLSNFKKKIKTTFRTTSPLYIVLFIIMLIYVIFLAYLMFWGIITSLKDVGEFNDNILGLPKELTFNNFFTIFSNFYVRVNVNGVLVPKFVEDMIKESGYDLNKIKKFALLNKISADKILIMCVDSEGVAYIARKDEES